MWLFLLGWIGFGALVAVVVVCVRARSAWDRAGPGTAGGKRSGCACSRVRNWFGVREALVDTSVLARGCPVLEHHPEMRRRMFEERSGRR